MLTTKRLILRPWCEDDAEELFKYACDPDVGPDAGWSPHTSVDESREIIRTVLSRPGNFAVVLQETGLVVGSASIVNPAHCLPEHRRLSDCEIGYWLGKSYWGRGLIPEAVRELQRYGFEDLGCRAIWCGHFDGNHKSRRVMDKCGFTYHHTEPDRPTKLGLRTTHYTRITRDEWQLMQPEDKQWQLMLDKARRVQNDRTISPFIDAGGVAAAIMSVSGHIYAGVCIDTAASLGMCAERNAMAHMITHGESRILKVAAIMPDGQVGSPCGVCREFMMQLDRANREAEILLDTETLRTVTLRELIPDWWGDARYALK